MKKQSEFSILLVLATAGWGGTFPMVKLSLEFMSPVIFLAVRFAVSAALMFPFLRRPLNLDNFKEGFIAGTFLFMGYYFQTVGLYFTTPAVSGLITGFYVVLVPIFSYLVYGSNIGRREWIAVFISMIGLLIITSGQVSSTSLQTGDILTIICAMGYAVQIIYVAKNRHIDMIKFTFYQMLTVCILSTAAIPTFPVYADFSSTIVIFSIIFTALVGGVLAYFIMNVSLVYVTPERASIIMVTEPVFAAAFSVLLTGIPLSYYTIIGGAVMVLSMIWVVHQQEPELAIELQEHPA